MRLLFITIISSYMRFDSNAGTIDLLHPTKEARPLKGYAMNMKNTQTPPLDQLKQQAKALRVGVDADGLAVSHSRSLELIARQYGYKDWNTLHSATGNQPPASPIVLGQHVKGHYLGQAFEGEVIGLQTLNGGNRYRVTLNFNEAVDVVTFEGMSNFRKRVSCTIGRDGKTVEKTSNGQPHMALDL